MTRTNLEHRTDAVGRRLLAFLVDAVVVGSLAAIVGIRRRGSALGRLGSTVTIGGVGGLLYHVLLEGTGGQTVGKRLLGVVVVCEDGGPCTYRAASIRTALRFVDWLPVGYLLGLAVIALTERRQRLGDLAAGTLVVRTGPETRENGG